MDLVDRYLQAVKFWLPRALKQDVIAELSEDIRSQIEERETEHGRPLDDAEVGAILKQVGRPVIVAQRYLPQSHLIGPVWFPIYIFVLKLVAAFYLLPWALVWVGLLSFDPGFRTAHGHSGWFETVGAFWADVWLAAIIALGMVTAVFAVLERVNAKSGIPGDWDPRKLPAVRDPNRIPRSGSIVELVVNIVFCSWWVAAMSSPVVFDRPQLRITLAPVWQYFYWGFLILSIAGIALSGANLLRPNWTRPRAAVRLLTNLVGSALFCWFCASSIVAEIAAVHTPVAETLKITAAVNMWMSRGVPVVAFAGLIVLVVDARRILRAATANQGPPRVRSDRGLPASTGN
jgi:hypothetical protein